MLEIKYIIFKFLKKYYYMVSLVERDGRITSETEDRAVEIF